MRLLLLLVKCQQCVHSMLALLMLHFVMELLLAWRAGPAPLELVWADEFDGPGIDAASWSFMLGNGSQYGLPGAHCFIPATLHTCWAVALKEMHCRALGHTLS